MRKWNSWLIGTGVVVLVTVVSWGGLTWGNELWGDSPVQALGMPLYRILYLAELAPEAFLQKLMPSERLHDRPLRLALACLMLGIGAGAVLPWLVRGHLRRRAQAVEAAGRVTRRRFIGESLAATALASSAGMAAYAVLFAPQRLQVRRYDAPIRDLPQELDGLKIAQLSDTHYGPFMPLRYLEHVVAEVNALNADLIVCTGDYAHKTPLAVRPGIELLRGLKAPLGVAAVLGNHDYWEGVNACRKVFNEIEIPLLENTSLSLGRAGLGAPHDFKDRICLAGVVDLWTDEPDVAKAKSGVPENVPTILLSHNPDYAEVATPGPRVDLMLSGHTHGGQVRIPGWGTPIVPSRYGQKYSGGWVDGPHWPVIVSRGVGMAVLPLRFRVPPEVCVITLKKA